MLKQSMKKQLVMGEAETQQSTTPKRPGSTIAPPEAKMAARPDSMTSYRNPKQEVIPSEAQLPGYAEGTEELEDDQLQVALKLSAQEVQRDPTETPNTGGSAASSSPSGFAGSPASKATWYSNIENKRQDQRSELC